MGGAAWLAVARTPAQVAVPSAAPPVPRAAGGRPDLSGIWQALNTASWNIQDHQAEKDVPAGQGIVEGNEIPYLPWAAAKREENYRNRLTADPLVKCSQPGVPRIMYMPYPFQIVQAPTYVAFLFEYAHTPRHIRLSGAHPPGPIEWALGDSRGRWEGETLVVDVVHFNDQTWFDRAGNFHGEQMHLVERFTLTDRDHIQYEVTVEDPKVFSRPWKMTMPLYRRVEKNVQILDYVCQSFQS
ncbi:MAG: hypothetical protein HYY76_07140 [Acidobacteria bacterium]|nr:hypothetical protein [Acidobacteriota bacterium]